LNHVLQTLPLKQNIQNLVLADYTLVDAPRFGTNFMVTDLKGEFYSIKSPQEAPFSPVQIPDVQNTNVMVQFTLAEYVPETLGFALWKQGLLVLHVNDAMIPPDSPVRFTTDSFKFIIPPLYEKYPGKNLEANIDPIVAPAITFENGGFIGVHASLELVMYVVNPTLIPVFTLGLDVVLKGKVLMNGHLIMANITYGNVTLSIRSTTIGPFDLSTLDDMVFLVLAEGLPAINQYLAKGVPLPTIPKVEFINPFLGYGPGYIFVNTDIRYTPSTTKNNTGHIYV